MSLEQKERTWSIASAACFGFLMIRSLINAMTSIKADDIVETVVLLLLVASLVMNKKNVLAGLGTGFYGMWYFIIFILNSGKNEVFMWCYMAASMFLLFLTVTAGRADRGEKDDITLRILWFAPGVLALAGFVLFLALSDLRTVPLSQWIYLSKENWAIIGAEFVRMLGFIFASFWIRNTHTWKAPESDGKTKPGDIDGAA